MSPENTRDHAREADGRWRPGASPNPGGRPAVLKEVRELARQHTEKAIARLAELLDDPDGRIVCAAAGLLLDRGWGKPEQSVIADVTVTPTIDIVSLREQLAARITGLALAREATVEARVLPPRHEDPAPPAIGAPAATEEAEHTVVEAPSPVVQEGEP